MGKEKKAENTIEIDGTEFWWLYRHGWGLNYGIGTRGASVSVWLHPDQTRELILDFPFATFKYANPPKKSDIVRELPACIRAALEDGWDPESRGKPYRFEVPEAE